VIPVAERYLEQHCGDLLIESLKQAVAYERGEPGAAVRVVTRTARNTRIAAPPAYSPERITRIRERLGLSQAVFASALNVSPGTVRSWEQGVRQPSGSALRLLQIAETAPDQFSAYLSELVTGSEARRLGRSKSTTPVG
jgi:putative transcriptional regulator